MYEPSPRTQQDRSPWEESEGKPRSSWGDSPWGDPEGESSSRTRPVETTVAAALVEQLAHLGVESAFGVSGGAIAMFFDALAESPIGLHHFRHETGAAFAAAEAYFVTGKPSLVFSTTGPGTLNALNGMVAAKWDGAKVILVSGATNAAQRGRWATQETSSYTLPQDALYTSGPLFDFAVRVESPAEFPEVVRRLSLGLARTGGFVAHICLPIKVQASRLDLPAKRPVVSTAAPVAGQDDVERCAELLRRGRFAVWAGFGAVKSAPRVRELVERTGAKVFCSPRAKGVIPEDHPQYLGVTGLGGHEEVIDYMVQHRPDYLLVLGTRLGEATSFWDRDMVPVESFIHVDLDPEVPGTAYPENHTIGIHSEIDRFLEVLIPLLPEQEPRKRGDEDNVIPLPVKWKDCSGVHPVAGDEESSPAAPQGRVRPQVVMEALQKYVIDGSDALIMGECGNSFAWCNHYLRFSEPERYRVSPRYGSMGHCAAGVVGAALARDGLAFAVVGDGSMLMNSEISTATQYGARAVWVILNDAGYGMCRDGHSVLGLTPEQLSIPKVDFVGFARSMGADGVLVEDEDDLDEAFQKALTARGPFLLDIRIDPDQASPLLKRFESLINQGNAKNVAGWER